MWLNALFLTACMTTATMQNAHDCPRMAADHVWCESAAPWYLDKIGFIEKEALRGAVEDGDCRVIDDAGNVTTSDFRWMEDGWEESYGDDGGIGFRIYGIGSPGVYSALCESVEHGPTGIDELDNGGLEIIVGDDACTVAEPGPLVGSYSDGIEGLLLLEATGLDEEFFGSGGLLRVFNSLGMDQLEQKNFLVWWGAGPYCEDFTLFFEALQPDGEYSDEAEYHLTCVEESGCSTAHRAADLMALLPCLLLLNGRRRRSGPPTRNAAHHRSPAAPVAGETRARQRPAREILGPH